MSSNNEILITRQGDKWLLKDRDVEGNGGFQIGEADSLEEAVRLANKYMGENEVEYGLNVVV